MCIDLMVCAWIKLSLIVQDSSLLPLKSVRAALRPSVANYPLRSPKELLLLGSYDVTDYPSSAGLCFSDLYISMVEIRDSLQGPPTTAPTRRPISWRTRGATNGSSSSSTSPLPVRSGFVCEVAPVSDGDVSLLLQPSFCTVCSAAAPTAASDYPSLASLGTTSSRIRVEVTVTEAARRLSCYNCNRHMRRAVYLALSLLLTVYPGRTAMNQWLPPC